VPAHLIPHRALLELYLAEAVKLQRFKEPKGHPQHGVAYTADVPREPEYAHLHEPADLTEDDIHVPHRAKAESLLKALHVGKVRAYKRAHPLELLENTRFNNSYYDEAVPGKNIKQGNATIVYWKQSSKQVHVTGHTPQLLEPQFMQPGKAYFLAIRANHVTDCNCVATYLNNNMPANFFVLVCMHKNATMFYGATAEAKDPMTALEQDMPSALNPTMVYFSKPSMAYTVLPVLVLRQSLAVLKRQPPRAYRPAFSSVNFELHPELVAALQAQVAKGEVLIRTKYLEEDAKPNGVSPAKPGTLENISPEHRFPTRAEQFACKEMLDRDPERNYSVDDLLNNSVFQNPAWGTLACPYCPDGMCLRVFKGLQEMIAHLLKHHRRLVRAYFTCPACLTSEVLTFTSYAAHFAKHHNPMMGLIVRMDETCVSSRLSWGLALLSVVQVMDCLHTAQVHEPQANEPVKIATSRGGYCEKTTSTPIELRDAVIRQRMLLLPPALQARVYQAWSEARQRPPSEARSSASASPCPSNHSYAVVTAPRPPQDTSYKPQIPRPQSSSFAIAQPQRVSTPQVREDGARATAQPTGAAPPAPDQGEEVTFLEHRQVPSRCAEPPTLMRAQSVPMVMSPPPVPQPGPSTSRPAVAAAQPRAAPTSLEPPPRRTVVFHRVDQGAQGESTDDLIESLRTSLANCPGPSRSAPLPPERDPLGLEAHLRGEPEKSKRKGKKSKGNRRDNAERIRDEVADFPDTPDMREPRQSSEDDEVARATAALIADAPRLNWADEVPTPPAVDPRQLQRARYSPSRVRADEYGVQGYDPTNFRDNMETDE
jgi:hypothetical protein